MYKNTKKATNRSKLIWKFQHRSYLRNRGHESWNSHHIATLHMTLLQSSVFEVEEHDETNENTVRCQGESWSKYMLFHFYFRLMAGRLDIRLTPTQRCIRPIPIVLLDLENFSVTVEITLQFCMGAELKEHPFLLPPSWIINFRLGRAVMAVQFHGISGSRWCGFGRRDLVGNPLDLCRPTIAHVNVNVKVGVLTQRKIDPLILKALSLYFVLNGNT